MHCINCGNEVAKNYCENCGQRTQVKRITWREGWNDFWARIYGFDGMFPRTIRDLTLQPGRVAQQYIDGNRVKYYGPVGYFFLMVTLYLLLMSALNVDIREFMQQTQQMFTPGNQNAGQQKMADIAAKIVSDNFKIIAFFMMPFNALAARYLVFRKSGYNFLEHMVIPFYVAGHVYWLAFVSVIVFKVFNSLVLNSVNAVVTLFYFGLAYTSFITYQPKWKTFIKGIFVSIIGQLLMFLVVVIVVIVAIILISYFDPETFESIRPSNH